MLDQANRTFICSVVFIDLVGYSKKTVTEQIRLKTSLTNNLSEAIKDIPVNDRIILDTAPHSDTAAALAGNGTEVASMADAAPENEADLLEAAPPASGAPVKEALTPRMRAALGYVARRYRVSSEALGPIFQAVQSTGTELSLDPLLIVAVIGIESGFNPLSQSVMGAQGLMQIIPGTAEEIAHALKWPNYQLNDLYRPLISIKFGVYYLAKQLDYLNGDLIAAWAAYNGGPGNAKRWQTAANGDVDLFVENISLSETRLYIERLRENLAMYQRLYAH